jgi:hypothetical protein
MKQNTVVLSILLVVVALLTYAGTARPDLIVSFHQEGSVMVRESMASHGQAFYGQKAGRGFVGTWTHSISTCDYPSSHTMTQTLVLNADGTASLVLKNKNRVGGTMESPQYKTDSNTRQGVWSVRGGEVWIDLEDIV